MAVRVFKGLTQGTTLTEASSFPVDIKSLKIRGIAVLSTSGTGVVSIKFKNGEIINTPRIPESTPYNTMYAEEISEILSMTGSTLFDIELLTLGV